MAGIDLIWPEGINDWRLDGIGCILASKGTDKERRCLVFQYGVVS